MKSSQIYMLVAWESDGRVQANILCENQNIQPEFILYSQQLWFLEQAQFRLHEHKLWHSKIKTVRKETDDWYLDARKNQLSR